VPCSPHIINVMRSSRNSAKLPEQPKRGWVKSFCRSFLLQRELVRTLFPSTTSFCKARQIPQRSTRILHIILWPSLHAIPSLQFKNSREQVRICRLRCVGRQCNLFISSGIYNSTFACSLTPGARDLSAEKEGESRWSRWGWRFLVKFFSLDLSPEDGSSQQRLQLPIPQRASDARNNLSRCELKEPR